MSVHKSGIEKAQNKKKRKLQMRRIVIIGASHHNTLSVVRCVGEVFGLVDLVLIGCVKSFVAKSKYVHSATFLKDSKDLYQWAKKNKDQTKSIVIS